MKTVELMQENFRVLRSLTDLTQDELAGYLGVKRQTVGAIETKRMKLSRLLAMAMVITLKFKGHAATNAVINTLFEIDGGADELAVKILEEGGVAK